jgi:DNA-directed RNA polymerase subunit RPC12/RpoP
MFLCKNCSKKFKTYAMLRDKSGLAIPACPYCSTNVVNGKFEIIDENIKKTCT